MKNLSLALLLALGASNVNAQTPVAAPTDASIQQSIESLGLSKKESNGVLAYAKKNPAIVAAAALVVLGATTGTGLYFARETKYGKIGWDFIVNSGNKVVTHATCAKDKAVEYKKTTAAVVTGILVLALAAYKKDDLVKLVKSYTSKEEAKSANTTVAA